MKCPKDKMTPIFGLALCSQVFIFKNSPKMVFFGYRGKTLSLGVPENAHCCPKTSDFGTQKRRPN